MNSNRIGFISSAAHPALPAGDDALYSFDSGLGLTLPDLNHHALISGATGSGKTASVAIPMLASLIERGCGGLIVDLKGNLREKVRMIAAACGAEHRLVEYGTSEHARPLNILRDMTPFQLSQFFENMVRRSFRGESNNFDFHVRGASQAKDCALLLRFLEGAVNGIAPNVATVAEMLTQQDLSREMYAWFKKNVFDPENEEHAYFRQTVENNVFHILYEPRNCDRSERGEQLNYALEGMRVAARRYLDAPGITEKFCSPGAPSLDMRKELQANSIVLQRFDPDTGPVGEELAREFVEAYYEAVYRLGLKLPRHTFVMLDEYQDIADLSDSRFSDKRFVAVAREFKSCVILITQSLSALGGPTRDYAAVQALSANCNTRIMFYSDDPLTQEMALRYGNVELPFLQPQQAFVVRYDAAARCHTHSLETVNKPYLLGIDILAKGAALAQAPQTFAPVPLPGLRELVKGMKNRGRTSPGPGQQPRPNVNGSESARDGRRPNPGTERPPCPAFDAQEEFGSDGPEFAPSPDPEGIATDAAADALPVPETPDASDTLHEQFPDLLHWNARLFIPAGWRNYVNGALRALRASGLPAKITAIEIDGARLNCEGSESDESNCGIEYLERLLTDVSSLCTVCGAPSRKFSRMEARLLCDACRYKFGLDGYAAESEDSGIPPKRGF